MKEKKTSKSLKAQLFSAVAMMLVATISLGSATYAWFVNNRTATVDTMNLTVDSAAALQIAVEKSAGSTYTEYKNLITLPDITGINADDSAYAAGADWVKMFKTPLMPSSASNTNVGADKFFLSTGAMADNLLTTFNALTRQTETTELGGDGVKKIPLSFLSSKDVNVFFGSKTVKNIADLITAKQSVLADDTAKAAEQAIFDQQRLDVMKALRIAIVAEDTQGTPNAPLIFQMEDGTLHVTGAAYNTDFTNVTKVNNTTVDGTTAPAAIAALQNEAVGSYAAVSAISAAEDATKNFTTEVTTQLAQYGTEAAKYFAAVVAGDPGKEDVVTAGTNPLFNLKAGVAKDVVVYIWLEGTDKDCVSVLSDYPFAVQLAFTGADLPVAP